MTKADIPKTAAELGIMKGSPPKQPIDISNWDKGPDNRWAFQHISEIVPTANISRGSEPPIMFSSAPRNITEIVFRNQDGVEVTVREFLDTTYTDGLIVLHKGNVIYEKYFNGMMPETRHLLMSVSKSVTGALAGKLVVGGLLDPNARVVQYIPELEGSSGYAEATVREILDMTTSIVFSEDYDDPEAEVIAHEEAMAWRGRLPLAEKGIYAFAQTIKKDKRNHGELFHYASINTDILGWLIERASGQRYVEYASETIWSKLGAERDAQMSVDYFGSAVANGGYCITLRDLARFAQMMLNRGFHNGQQIVPSEWVEDIRFNGNNSTWKPTQFGEVWPHGFYRNQWYVTKDEHESFFAVGVNGQHIWIDPAMQVAIVKFSSHPVSAHLESTLNSWLGMNAIASMLGED